MSETLLPVYEFLDSLSANYGTGDTNGDIILVLIALVILSALIFTFTFMRTAASRRKARSASPRGPSPFTAGKSKFESRPAADRGDGHDRASSVLGRVERFEMELNSIRTETMREITFLKNRVQHLEEHLAKNSDDFSPAKSLVSEPVSGSGVKAPVKAVEEIREVRSPSQEFHPDDILKDGPIVSDVIAQPVEIEEIEEESKSLSGGLQKTRRGIFSKIKSLFSSGPIVSEEMLEEVQAHLISADIGVKTVDGLVEELKDTLRSGEEVTESFLTEILKEKVLERLNSDGGGNIHLPTKKQADGPSVIMMIGVNGAGKTTTSAKIAHKLKLSGSKVLLVAADTFRAAAVEQLKSWGERIGVPVVAGEEGARPSAVVYDAMERAKKEDTDVVIIDTAGRLHTKSNLMQELEGMNNIIQKHQPDAPHESLLVLDGASGQNAVQQAREFHQAIPLTGLIVTKLDGTPKGGVVIAIKDELGIPLRYIGVGEGTEDLKEFEPEAFVDALFDSSDIPAQAAQLNGEHAKRRRRRRDTLGA